MTRYALASIRIAAIASTLTFAATGSGVVAAEAAPAEATPATQPAVPLIAMGSPAPAFVGKMIQGENVAEWENGKVYVFEFWATWCLPCKAAIPHLNELHNKYKDKGVIFIGQSVFEQDAEAAPAFVKKMGDAMSYRIALDVTEEGQTDSSGGMARTWLHAAGINAIPSTWIVRNGKVLWIGHPKDLDTLKIESALAGTFDILGAKKEGKEKTERQQLQLTLQTRFWDALHDRDAATVEATLKELDAFFTERPETSVAYRLRALVGLGRYEEAKALAATYPNQAKTPREAFVARLRAVQDMLVTNPRDQAFLAEVKAMLDAIELPETDNPKGPKALVLKLQAWVICLQGDSAAAVKLQEEALSLMADSPLKPLEVKALEGYQNGRPPALMPKHSRDKKKPATQPAN